MKSIYDFLAKFKTYLNQKNKSDFWTDPKHRPYGNLLVKSLLSNKKIIFKPIDSTLPIGSKRIQDFISNTPTFKKKSIDNYIFIARNFKENAIKLSKSNKQLTLITFDFRTNNIMLIGSKNLDKDILKAINEFSKYLDGRINKIKRNHIDTKTQPENKPNSLHNKSLKSDKSITNETTEFTKKQRNWFIGIVIFIVIIILLIGNYKPSVPYSDNKPIIEKEEKKRNPEIIYTEIKKALADDFPGTCKILFNEMQTDYPNSILFDSVKIIYDSAMNIVQLKKEEARKKREEYEAQELKRIKFIESNSYIHGDAAAYSDGGLSCNIYLFSKDGEKQYYLDAKNITYSVYSTTGSIINPIGKITYANTKYGLYIDIPLGRRIFEAKLVTFNITTSTGKTYKLRKLPIIWE